MIIELFAAAQCLVAEGPRWCAAENALYWVDITAGCVLRKKAGTPPDAFERFDPKLGKIGAFAFGKDGKLLLFTERCEIHEAVFGGKPELKWMLPGHAATRFNDVFDAGGGVYFCGVAPIRPDVRGELWRFDAVTGTAFRRTARRSTSSSATSGESTRTTSIPQRGRFLESVSSARTSPERAYPTACAWTLRTEPSGWPYGEGIGLSIVRRTVVFWSRFRSRPKMFRARPGWAA